MKKFLFVLFCLPAAAFLLAAFYKAPVAPVTDRPLSSRFTLPPCSVAQGFAVIELFTSEGCSSCPPADVALSDLAVAYPGKVYALGFHVDYWDKLGWKDAYSSSDYTDRQKEYTRILRVRSSYTPQAIINGWHQMNGSDETQLKAAIEEELSKPVEKTIELHADFDGKKIKVSYKLINPGMDRLNVALVQSHAESQVRAGENSGHTLQHVNIVRDFKTEGPGSGGSGSGSMSFKLPKGLAAKDIKVIAYLQNTGEWNSTISAAADAPVTESGPK
ncbi:MAG TPA: DUF1223 domain-containing protein [Puia sp.]|nr:DUF1223 domain-containing protein [Puia sp.]